MTSSPTSCMARGNDSEGEDSSGSDEEDDDDDDDDDDSGEGSTSIRRPDEGGGRGRRRRGGGGGGGGSAEKWEISPAPSIMDNMITVHIFPNTCFNSSSCFHLSGMQILNSERRIGRMQGGVATIKSGKGGA